MSLNLVEHRRKIEMTYLHHSLCDSVGMHTRRGGGWILDIDRVHDNSLPPKLNPNT
jgi:hypothetical protein